jgi:peptide/nickel transport system permease protein
MQQYIIKRLLLAVPTIFGAITLVFFAMQAAPGDPSSLFIRPDMPPAESAEMLKRINEKYGFDDPIYVQYFRYIQKLVRLDLGESLREGTSVLDDLKSRLPNTLRLGLAALAISAVLGISLGVLSAIHRGTWIDNVAISLALIGVSIPSFWLALTLILIFALRLPWLPPSGLGGSSWSWDGMKAMILPMTVLVLGSAGGLARYTRSAMLEVINQDYVRTARAKGLREKAVVVLHAMRNALIPVVTVLALQVPDIFGGAIITEQIFRIPGIGSLLISSILSNDTPVVMAVTFVFACLVVLFNLIADILYGWLDPRISFR